MGKIANFFFSILAAFSLSISGTSLWNSDGIAMAPPSQQLKKQDLLQVPSGFNMVGHIGGTVQSVAVQGNHAYLGLGNELAILDVSNPNQPARIGYIYLGGEVHNLIVSGNFIYATVWKITHYYLFTLDISNPKLPRIRFNELVPDYISRIYMVEGYLYSVGTALRIFDLSDPTQPTEISFFSNGKYGNDIVVDDGIAYIANSDNGLLIIDVSNPSTPVEIGLAEIDWYATAVEVKGNYAYVADSFLWSYSRLRVIDISNPAAPITVSIFNPFNNFQEGVIKKIKSYEWEQKSYLLVSYLSLLLIDIENPLDPVQINLVEKAHPEFTFVNGFIYLAQWLPNGLQILEMTAAGHIQTTGEYTAPYGMPALVEYDKLIYSNFHQNLIVIDAANPVKPELISSIEINDGPILKLVIKDKVLYALSRGSIHTFNLDIPHSPKSIGTLNLPSYAFGFVVDQKIVYVATNEFLYVFDYTEADKPVPLAVYPGAFSDIAVQDGYAFLVGTESKILNIQDFEIIQEVAILPCGGTNIIVKDSFAYMASFSGLGCENGLYVIDISNPAEPEHAGFVNIDKRILNILLKENIAFISYAPFYGSGNDFRWHGIIALDLSNISTPLPVGEFFIRVTNGGLAIDNDYLYVSSLVDGLFILKFGSEITGRTLLRNLLPFRGAAVSAGAQFTTSDSQGRYRLTNLPSGFYHLEASYESFGSWPYPHQVNASEDVMGEDLYIVPARKSELLDPVEPTVITITDPQNLQLTLEFLPGAAPAETPVTVVSIMAFPIHGMAFAGHAFDLLASLTTFSRPVTVTVEFSPADTAVISEQEGLALLYYSLEGWIDAAHTCPDPGNPTLDLEAGYLRLEVCKTGRYALFGPSQHVVLPFIFR